MTGIWHRGEGSECHCGIPLFKNGPVRDESEIDDALNFYGFGTELGQTKHPKPSALSIVSSAFPFSLSLGMCDHDSSTAAAPSTKATAPPHHATTHRPKKYAAATASSIAITWQTSAVFRQKSRLQCLGALALRAKLSLVWAFLLWEPWA